MDRKPNVKLKTELFKRSITQRQLAFGIGVDEGSISRAIRYSMDTPEIRKKIASFLGIEEMKLFEDDKSREKEE